ncbi:PREDICTED: chromobox protein homolog 2 isoform X3 [Dufourea novaeangliae]|uniref:chromobox protein homolog 2 isoform X3 n=1 Tax=Dufourea novaeangliae TaxID=178035 RepID=UPI0007674C71|nr:PREDICTED: chromobox protein homolog 2 isoform X3 [Dufourea novaeangliae]
MEGGDGPSAISSNPTAIKAAQEEMGRLDVLVCGQCHSVFHFIEEFQEHRTKEGACTQVSHFRENSNNEQKAQVWAFLLWKDSQIQQEGSDRDSTNSWKLYQKWCKMDTHIRDSWIAAGKTIQTFTKISNAKMQDVPRQNQITNAEGKPVLVRKVIRNGQPEEGDKKDAKGSEAKNQKSESFNAEGEKKEKPKLKPSIKPKGKSSKAGDEDKDTTDEEYTVEKILAKRFNPKKRCSEYLLKWEGYTHEHNTWEPAEHVATCKHLLEEFERNLAKQKELKAAQQQANAKAAGRGGHLAQKTVIKAEAKPGPSTAAQVGRPMRSSKSKAMDQVKQWCGSMKDEDNDLLGKRRMDYSESDSEDGGSSAAKRAKADTGQRNADGRPLLPRPPLRATTPTSVLGIGSTIRTPVRAPAPRQVQAQQTRQVLQKRTTTVTTQSNSVSPVSVTQIRPKFTVLSSQPKQVVKSGTSPVQQQAKQSPKTPVGKPQSLLSPQQKLLMAKRKAQEAAGIIKPGGRGLLAGARTSIGRGRGKLAESPTSAAPGGKPKESKLAEGDGLHMEFHEVGSEESSSDGEPELPPPPETDNIATAEPDSPPRPFTLCPLTGRIIGPDGEPVEQPAEPEPEPEQPTTPLTTVKTPTTTSESIDVAATTSTTELVLPSLDSLTDGSGIMRVEMSPGGTTGTIVQTSEPAQMNLSNVNVPAPDLPCLDDTAPPAVPVPATTASAPLPEATPTTETAITAGLSTATVTSTSTIAIASADVTKPEEKVPAEERKVAEDTSNLVTITGEDGVVYQVAGQAEDGQTLLVTRDADGEQQCVYVTTEQQGDDGSVLTLDHAVAEAVAQLIPDQVNLASQFYVKEGGTEPAENPMVMSIMDNTSTADVAEGQEDGDGNGQVVAQVVQAEEPTPGGTRRVVLLLPDGNLMMTEVTEEQYAALGLGK